MTISKRTLATAYFLLALLVLSLAARLVMLNSENGEAPIYPYAVMGTFILWSGFIFPVVRRGYIEIPSSTIIIFNIYILWTVLITAVMPGPDIKATRYVLNVVWMVLPMMVANVVYYFTLRRGKNKPFLFMTLAIALLLLYTYFSYYDISNALLEVHLGTSYYTLFMLPLVLCFPSRIVKIIVLLLISFAIFSSIKRGGVIAIIAAMLVYIFIQQFVIAKRSKAVKIIIIVGTVVLLSGMVIFLATFNDSNLLERFEGIEEDQGSGRTVVWSETWRLITSQDVIGMLIGNGYNSVLRDSRFVLSAHNDYLEAWYDFGLIGVLLYVIAILSLFYTNILAIRRKHDCAPAYSAMSVMVLILSIISHIGIYFWMNLVMMSFAYFIGWMDHDRKCASLTPCE